MNNYRRDQLTNYQIYLNVWSNNIKEQINDLFVYAKSKDIKREQVINDINRIVRKKLNND